MILPPPTSPLFPYTTLFRSHIFHSAPIETFTLADGRPGVLCRWLQHCAAIEVGGRPKAIQSRVGQVDSEFEAEVAAALRARAALVIHQYPACGFHIDLVCEKDDARVAVECDGERYHLDEHGQPRIEDLEREAILRRASWHIVRIPYRKWLNDRDAAIACVFDALEDKKREDSELLADLPDPEPVAHQNAPVLELDGLQTARSYTVSRTQEAIIKALREGLTAEDDWLFRVRDLVGLRRLTARRREEILREAGELGPMGLVTVEDREYFLTPAARGAKIDVVERFGDGRTLYRRRRRRWRY